MLKAKNSARPARHRSHGIHGGFARWCKLSQPRSRLNAERRGAGSWQPLKGIDVAIIDGTNLYCKTKAETKHRQLLHFTTTELFSSYLTFLRGFTQAATVYVVFDSTDRQSSDLRQKVSESYLVKRRSRKGVGGAAGPGGTNPSALEVAAKQAGAKVLQTPPGYESDDIIAGVVQALQAQRSRPPPGIVLISADKDMQQLLSPSVSWLETHQYPTASLPSCLALQTHRDFQDQFAFTPEAYAHYLALVGKPESGVRSVGISGSIAGKLLARYSTISGIQAAAASGELTRLSYPPTVISMFQPSGPAVQEREIRGASEGGTTTTGSRQGGITELALKNLEVVMMRPESVELLPEDALVSTARKLSRLPQWTWQQAALQHPAHHLHHQACAALIRRLLQAASALSLRTTSPHVTPSGQVADIAIINTEVTQDTQPSTAVLVLGPGDFAVPRGMEGRPYVHICEAVANKAKRKNLLHVPKGHLAGGMQVRLRLLQQDPDIDMRVAPYFEIPDDPAACIQYLASLLAAQPE